MPSTTRLAISMLWLSRAAYSQISSIAASASGETRSWFTNGFAQRRAEPFPGVSHRLRTVGVRLPWLYGVLLRELKKRVHVPPPPESPHAVFHAPPTAIRPA